MDTEIKSQEQTKEVQADHRKSGVKAWHDANTPEKKKATVKQFPFLAHTYEEARHLA